MAGTDVSFIRVTIPARDKDFEIELDPSRHREHIVSLEPGGNRGQSINLQQGKLVSAAGTGEFGKPDGVVYSFHEKGTILAEKEYFNGTSHGRVREWFETGQLQRTGTYEKGWPVGEWKEYFPEGGVREIAEYFPPSTDIRDIHRPLRRRQRCEANGPWVDVVVNGKLVANSECKQ